MPRVIQIHEWGGPDVLELEDAPKPSPKGDEVLIRVRAASVNPLDWKIRQGVRRNLYSVPYVPGCDVAGNVEIGGSYPLERAADAHRPSETGHARGKIVLTFGSAG